MELSADKLKKFKIDRSDEDATDEFRVIVYDYVGTSGMTSTIINNGISVGTSGSTFTIAYDTSNE